MAGYGYAEPKSLNLHNDPVGLRTSRILEPGLNILSADYGQFHLHGFENLVGDDAKELLANNGYSPREGARKLRRQVEIDLEEPMAEIILKGKVEDKDTIVVSTSNKKFTFDVIKESGKKKKKKEKKS